MQSESVNGVLSKKVLRTHCIQKGKHSLHVGKDMGKPMGITAPTHTQPTSYPYPPTRGYLISWVTQMSTWVPTCGGLIQGFIHIKI